MSLDRLDPGAAAVLDAFRAAGVLTAVDVHTAAALSRLGGDDRPAVVLAVALAVRAPRYGHVCVDLRTVAQSAVAEADTHDDRAVEVEDLPWPGDLGAWASEVADSPLVTRAPAPLVLDGDRLYLERYRQYETEVVGHLVRRSRPRVARLDVDEHLLTELLDGDGAERQRAAVRSAVASGLSVLVGGPGTGKTRTVAALLATLMADGRPLDIALAAPTGKAAARLTEAFRSAAGLLPADLGARLAAAEATTIHRLLGWQARSASRFRHDATHPLPHDVVIIDETSMVSLPLMAKLLDAVRPDASVVLVGDPGQLASVEAGSVLGDVAGPVLAADGATIDRPGPLAGVVSSLTHSHRFPPGSPLDLFARAVRQGDADEALTVLDDPRSATAPRGALIWHRFSGDSGQGAEVVRSLAMPAAEQVVAAALGGDADMALAGLGAVRVLCAHRRGPFGVDRWNALMESWLAEAGHRSSGWYVGRPLLVTENDYPNRLFNGDLGVVVRTGASAQVAFADASGTRLVAPSRLSDVETVHAMTIHKSQGSEFDHVVVVVPSADSRLATRELLYTAVTRAQRRVTLVGDEASIRASIGRRVVRASGLADRLWPG